MPREVRQLKFTGAQKMAAETSPKAGVRSGSLRSTYAPHVGEKQKRRALAKFARHEPLSEVEERILDAFAIAAVTAPKASDYAKARILIDDED